MLEALWDMYGGIMEATWTELSTLIRDTPRSSGAIRKKLAWLFSGVTALLRRGTRAEIERFLRAGDSTTRAFEAGSEATDSELRYWYGGHCHAIVSICR